MKSSLLPKTVQELIHDYVTLLRENLPEAIHGVYLYGSIALNSFDHNKSDIDFVTITTRYLHESEKKLLKSIHKKLITNYPYGDRMDGVYIRLNDLGKENHHLDPYPFFCSRGFKASGHWDVNDVTWWMLKKQSIRFHGPLPEDLPFDVTFTQLAQTMKYNIRQYWAGKAKNSLLFLLDEWVEAAVLTLCRIVYTLEHHSIVSKVQAGQWGVHALDDHWHPLIKEGLRLRLGDMGTKYRGTRLSRAKLSREFVHYISDYCESKYF